MYGSKTLTNLSQPHLREKNSSGLDVRHKPSKTAKKIEISASNTNPLAHQAGERRFAS